MKRHFAAALGVLCISSLAFAQPKDKHEPLPAGESYQQAPPADATDLMVNSGLENPSETGDGPAFWQRPDNLVWQWVDSDDAAHGKIIRINTDVNQRQAYDWWVDFYFHGKPLSAAPRKAATKPPRYDTVAGLDGGFYISDFIPIKDGGAYRVYVDVKSDNPCMVFIFGYTKKLAMSFADEQPAVQQLFRKARGESDVTESGRAKKYRLRYRYRTWFQSGGDGEWRTYTHQEPRHPNDREITEDVRWIRVMLYPYWPPGVYEFDNIRVYEVPPSETRNRRDADDAEVEEGRLIKPREK